MALNNMCLLQAPAVLHSIISDGHPSGIPSGTGEAEGGEWGGTAAPRQMQ